MYEVLLIAHLPLGLPHVYRIYPHYLQYQKIVFSLLQILCSETAFSNVRVFIVSLGLELSLVHLNLDFLLVQPMHCWPAIVHNNACKLSLACWPTNVMPASSHWFADPPLWCRQALIGSLTHHCDAGKLSLACWPTIVMPASSHWLADPPLWCRQALLGSMTCPCGARKLALFYLNLIFQLAPRWKTTHFWPLQAFHDGRELFSVPSPITLNFTRYTNLIFLCIGPLGITVVLAQPLRLPKTLIRLWLMQKFLRVPKNSKKNNFFTSKLNFLSKPSALTFQWCNFFLSP
jgi:hypothetical protein